MSDGVLQQVHLYTGGLIGLFNVEVADGRSARCALFGFVLAFIIRRRRFQGGIERKETNKFAAVFEDPEARCRGTCVVRGDIGEVLLTKGVLRELFKEWAIEPTSQLAVCREVQC